MFTGATHEGTVSQFAASPCPRQGLIQLAVVNLSAGPRSVAGSPRLRIAVLCRAGEWVP
jgi:hypothetical protein